MYEWIVQYGQIIAFVAQIIYWFGMLIAIFYAVAQYKRWVNYQLGTGRSGRLRTGEDAPETAAESEPKVDDFVD